MITNLVSVHAAATTTRVPADERRKLVLTAAIAAFARDGYAGTSTEEIAAAAGISQPYLFRLFGTKRDLFVATMGLMHERIADTFRAAAEGHSGEEAMLAMGEAYKALLSERDLLLLQLHAYAAAGDDDIRRAGRDGFRRLWDIVGELTGLPEAAVRAFFAQGMLLNVMAAIDAGALDEGWARAACDVDPDTFFSASGLR
ncbi:MAG: TetR/AcrR family transcriptional regulator [Gemmatimonadales bacterium]